MLGENFYEQVHKKPLFFFIYNIIVIVFCAGISFTFVIPGLKGFEWYFLIVALLMYSIVANIFIGLLKERFTLVFILSLLFSFLGMGWRLWLEWGEFSLVEHMNPAVLIGYPFAIAFIILLIFYISSIVKKKNSNY